jgi:hypothetical protein
MFHKRAGSIRESAREIEKRATERKETEIFCRGLRRRDVKVPCHTSHESEKSNFHFPIVGILLQFHAKQKEESVKSGRKSETRQKGTIFFVVMASRPDEGAGQDHIFP